MTVQRRLDLDTAKGWGMLLVVLGHASPPEWVATLIYGFHMPLFFFVSGVLWKGNVQPAHVWRSLMWPFLWGSLVTWAVWLIKVLIVKSNGVPLWGPLLATLYGGNLYGYLIHNTPLWFLPSLFSLYIVIWLLMYFTKTRATLSWSLVLLGTVTLLLAPWIPASRVLPLSLGQGMVGGLFFATGVLSADRLQDRRATNTMQTVSIIGVFFTITIFAVTVYMNGRVDLFSMQFGNPLLYFLNGLLGSLLMLTLCRQSFMQWAPISKIGAHSLQVLVLHQPVLWGLRFVSAKVNIHMSSIGLTVSVLLLFLLGFKLQSKLDTYAKQRKLQGV